MLEAEFGDTFVGVLPKSGLTGNPPAVEDGAEVPENILNGLGLEPNAGTPPLVSALFDEPKPPIVVVVLVEDAERAANPPVDEVEADPKVGAEDPNIVVGLSEVFWVEVEANPPPSGEVAPKVVSEVPPSGEVAPNVDVVMVSSVFLLNAANGDLVGGLPNVSPLDVPDPKTEGEVLDPNDDDNFEPEPNAADPVTPNENAGLFSAVFVFLSCAV